MKKLILTNPVVIFLNSMLFAKILLFVLTVYFVLHFLLLSLLLMAPPFVNQAGLLSLFILGVIGWIIYELNHFVTSKNATINNTNEPLDNYLSCLLKTSKLEEDAKQKNEAIKQLRCYQSKLTNKYLQILTRNVFLKLEIKNVVKALQKDYKLTYECHKCGSVIDDFEKVEYHSEVCSIQIN